MNITSYHQINKRLQEKEVSLVAVSKTKPVEDIKAVYQEGQRIFGENRAKEMQEKYEQLPKDIEWHMIGHLQSKKVKLIAPFVSLIHSVDSLSLLDEVNKRAKENKRTINILLQFHIAQEKNKYGIDETEIDKYLDSINNCKNVSLRGIMGMATFTDDKKVLSNEFKKLKHIFENLKQNQLKSAHDFNILSMGMSGDYEIAIEEGSNMVRLGSLIFGERPNFIAKEAKQ